MLNFHQPRKIFNNENFPIYGTHIMNHLLFTQYEQELYILFLTVTTDKNCNNFCFWIFMNHVHLKQLLTRIRNVCIIIIIIIYSNIIIVIIIQTF